MGFNPRYSYKKIARPVGAVERVPVTDLESDLETDYLPPLQGGFADRIYPGVEPQAESLNPFEIPSAESAVP